MDGLLKVILMLPTGRIHGGMMIQLVWGIGVQIIMKCGQNKL